MKMKILNNLDATLNLIIAKHYTCRESNEETMYIGRYFKRAMIIKLKIYI